MGVEEKVPSGWWSGRLGDLTGELLSHSVWPAAMGLACCAIEFMATGGPDYDFARYGMEVFRATPRQADFMCVSGRLSNKMAPVLRQCYDQMAEPKWVIAMGACASSGGMFNNYAIVQGIDHVVPVDIYLPGCPPRPQMLMNALLMLQQQIREEPFGPDRERVARLVEQAALQEAPLHRLPLVPEVRVSSEQARTAWPQHAPTRPYAGRTPSGRGPGMREARRHAPIGDDAGPLGIRPVQGA